MLRQKQKGGDGPFGPLILGNPPTHPPPQDSIFAVEKVTTSLGSEAHGGNDDNRGGLS